jgi:hypothetical protein
MSVIDSIMNYIVDADDYTRMQLHNDVNHVDDSVTYPRFREWNRQCLERQGPVELNWLLDLCSRIGHNQIQLMDLESCVPFTAYAIYYDNEGKLCIVNPR